MQNFLRYPGITLHHLSIILSYQKRHFQHQNISIILRFYSYRENSAKKGDVAAVLVVEATVVAGVNLIF